MVTIMLINLGCSRLKWMYCHIESISMVNILEFTDRIYGQIYWLLDSISKVGLSDKNICITRYFQEDLEPWQHLNKNGDTWEHPFKATTSPTFWNPPGMRMLKVCEKGSEFRIIILKEGQSLVITTQIADIILDPTYDFIFSQYCIIIL